jgi:predicted  nucleic acid-binding Zn-ribbon protein
MIRRRKDRTYRQLKRGIAEIKKQLLKMRRKIKTLMKHQHEISGNTAVRLNYRGKRS